MTFIYVVLRKLLFEIRPSLGEKIQATRRFPNEVPSRKEIKVFLSSNPKYTANEHAYVMRYASTMSTWLQNDDFFLFFFDSHRILISSSYDYLLLEFYGIFKPGILDVYIWFSSSSVLPNKKFHGKLRAF